MLLASITIIASICTLVWAIPLQAVQMPSIFDKIGLDGSYHMMSELELTNGNSKDRFIIEEWVSLSLGLARVDILQSGERKTFLMNGQTGEKFVYQEYKCSLFNELNYWTELNVLGNYLLKYKIENNEKFKKDPNIFGIGAMWMLAQATKGQSFLGAKHVPTSTRPNFFDYDMYGAVIELKSLNDRSDDRGHGLNLYFKPLPTSDDNNKTDTDNRELKIMSWVKKGRNDGAIACANIFLFEPSIENHHLSLFELPEGYGCKRLPEYSRPSEEKYKFKQIDSETPQQMNLDVAVMLPTASDQNVWQTQTATVMIISGRMDETHRYAIVETRQRLHNSKPPKTKQLKNIYDLSREYHNILYSIDQETNECKIEKVSERFGPVVNFYKQTAKSTEPINVTITTDNINYLFAENDGFHLIKTVPLSNRDFYMLVHERSIEKFQAGALKGRASIVRKTIVEVSSVSKKNNQPQQTISTIYVYDTDENRPLAGQYIKGKITLRLYDRTEINRVYLHKQLDISDCLDEQKKEYAIIKYPLEEPDIGDQLAASSDAVYSQFMEAMFVETGLEPTQLSKLEINFDNYNMIIRMLIVDGPPKQMRYKMTKGMTLNSHSTDGILIEEIQPTSEKCAQACEFYKCKGFSYCTTNRCILYVRDMGNNESGMKESIFPNYDCSLYEDKQFIQHDTSPHKIIVKIRDEIKLSEDITDITDAKRTEIDYYYYNYLSLHIKLSIKKLVHLTPISIESDLFDEDYIFRERKSHSRHQQSLIDGPKDTRTYITDNLVLAQYIVEGEGRKFDVPSNDFQYTAADHLTYEDCATFCQDIDCKSFSYCQSEMKCVATNLHDHTIVQSHTVNDAHCTILMRDYLSKFEMFSTVPWPKIQDKSLKKLVKNARECASICLNLADADCLSFDYCPSKGECYLYGQHASIATGDAGDTVSYADSCEHYSRSYLVDFDKYFDAHLAIPKDVISISESKDQQLIVTGIDTETCAKLCTENDLCSGFSVCFDPFTSIKLECDLAQVQLKKSYLERKQYCNTYLLSARSQFNTLIRQVEPSDCGNVEKQFKEEEALTNSDYIESTANDNETNTENTSIGLISGVMFVLFGAALGSGSVFAFNNKERLKQIVSS